MTTQPLPAAPLQDDAAPVPRPAPIGRRIAVAGLVVGAVLNLTEAMLARVVGPADSVAESLANWSDRPTLSAIGLTVGTIAVPFLLLGLLAMAQLFRPHTPRLGATVMGLALAGGLGFYSIHTLSIIDAAAAEQPDRDAMVALIETAQGSPLALLVLLPFMIGIPLSVLLVGIGFLRTRVVPIWIPVALLVFLVLDFGPFSTGPVDPHWLFVAASLGVARTVLGLTDRQWWAGRTTEAATS